MCGLNLSQRCIWVLKGSIPGGNIWQASIPRELAKAVWPLPPSLRSHIASFMASYVGESCHKPTQIQGKGIKIPPLNGRRFQNFIFSDHHSRFCTQHSVNHISLGEEISVLLSTCMASIPATVYLVHGPVEQALGWLGNEADGLPQSSHFIPLLCRGRRW